MPARARLVGGTGRTSLLRIDRCSQPQPRYPHHLRPDSVLWTSQRSRPCAVRPPSPAQKAGLLSLPAAATVRHFAQATSAWTGSSPSRGPKRIYKDLGDLVGAVEDGEDIRLTFAGSGPEGHTFNLPALWFRDACQCSVCVSESSGQKRFATCDIDRVPQTESCRVLEDGSLEIVWVDDFLQGGRHPSVYDADFIRRLLQHTLLPEIYTPGRLIWDRFIFEQNLDARNVSYSDWMGGGAPFAKAFLHLMRWGLIFVKGVPETEPAVQDIANKIGTLQSTFYGDTWDVVSKPNAENAAYTNEFLCLHQDLMYWNPVPRIQLLHCLKNECEGGESLFSDGLRAAAELRYGNPEHYELLREVPVAYQYSRNGNYYRRARPVIKTAGSSRNAPPKDVSWSPPFQGAFPPSSPRGDGGVDRKRCQTLPAWRDAARSFRDSLEAAENMFQYRLQPGDCVVFDNTRILHGRTRFDTSSGHRRLRGTYLDSQTLNSALTRLVKEGLLTVASLGTTKGEHYRAINMYGHRRGRPADNVGGSTS